MAKYNVVINFSSDVNYEVEANSEYEARMIACDKADPYDCTDFDYEVDSVERINEE